MLVHQCFVCLKDIVHELQTLEWSLTFCLRLAPNLFILSKSDGFLFQATLNQTSG